jgi:hypothetical protein
MADLSLTSLLKARELWLSQKAEFGGGLDFSTNVDTNVK